MTSSSVNGCSFDLADPELHVSSRSKKRHLCICAQSVSKFPSISGFGQVYQNLISFFFTGGQSIGGGAAAPGGAD